MAEPPRFIAYLMAKDGRTFKIVLTDLPDAQSAPNEKAAAEDTADP